MGGIGDLGKALGNIGGVLKGDAGILGAINPTAFIGTAAAMGDTLYGAYANKKEAKKEREWQKYMVDYQNAYNTPAAQMARYKEAGLNPNLIYGQSNMSASTGSVPHANIPASHIADRGLAALRLGQDLQLGQEQINQVKASTALVRAQTANTNVSTDVLKHDLANTPDFLSPRDHGVIATTARVGSATLKEEKNMLKRAHEVLKKGTPSGKKDIVSQIKYVYTGRE